MDDKITIVCQNCSQQLSVPTDQGALHVTCPRCKATWEHIFDPDQMARRLFGTAKGAAVFDLTPLFEKARIRCKACNTDNPMTPTMTCRSCGESLSSSLPPGPPVFCMACQTPLNVSDPVRAIQNAKCPKCGKDCLSEIFDSLDSLLERTASAQSTRVSPETSFQQPNSSTGAQKVSDNSSDHGSLPLPNIEESDWSKISLTKITIAGWLLVLSCAVPMALGAYFGIGISKSYGVPVLIPLFCSLACFVVPFMFGKYLLEKKWNIRIFRNER